MDFSNVPVWLGTAVLGAVLAALGYVGKQVAEWLVQLRVEARQRQTQLRADARERRTQLRAEARQRRARLAELLALVRAGDAAFKVQSDDRDRLAESIVARRPELNPAGLGYDSQFALAYPTMTGTERELHDVVRGYTIHTFQPLNEALLKWIQADTEFRVAPMDESSRGKLAQYLADLEAHLLLWQAKYRIWMPEHPERALVYLDDEKKHGVGFPKGGVGIVLAVLQPAAAPTLPAAAGAEKRR